MGSGVQRWYFNIRTWAPSEAEWEFALSLLPEHERAQVTRFRFDKGATQPSAAPLPLVCLPARRRRAVLAPRPQTLPGAGAPRTTQTFACMKETAWDAEWISGLRVAGFFLFTNP